MTAATAAKAATPDNTLVIELSSGGNVLIELLPDVAPKHVARIKELAKAGFYDGIVFHRVIPGFMAQTGDPTGTGTGGSGKGNVIEGMENVDKVAVGEPPANPTKMTKVRLQSDLQ